MLASHVCFNSLAPWPARWTSQGRGGGAMNDQTKTLGLTELVDSALSHGVKQLEAVGTPLHPFFLDETGKIYLLVDNVGGVDPMEMALPAIKKHAPAILRCALVIDTRITLQGAKKWDAIVVM